MPQTLYVEGKKIYNVLMEPSYRKLYGVTCGGKPYHVIARKCSVAVQTLSYFMDLDKTNECVKYNKTKQIKLPLLCKSDY